MRGVRDRTGKLLARMVDALFKTLTRAVSRPLAAPLRLCENYQGLDGGAHESHDDKRHLVSRCVGLAAGFAGKLAGLRYLGCPEGCDAMRSDDSRQE